MCLGVVGIHAPKRLLENQQGEDQGALHYIPTREWYWFPQAVFILIVFYNVIFLLLFMFVVITLLLVAGHSIVPFALVISIVPIDRCVVKTKINVIVSVCVLGRLEKLFDFD
jgi:hypothetical protein